MMKQRRRAVPVTASKGINKVKEVVVPSITIVPATDDDDGGGGGKDCAVVEPTTVMFEEYDIRKDATTTENDPSDLFNCKSYMFHEGRHHECTSSGGGITPTYVVEGSDVNDSGSFIKTFKTLMDISITSNCDDLGSLSSGSDNGKDDDDNSIPFDILEPIRTASQNILKKSTQFLQDIITDECLGEKTADVEPKFNEETKAQSSWSLDRLTKWL